MNYILKGIKLNGAPTVNTETGEISQDVTVITGIEGDEYDFIRTDTITGTSSMKKTGQEISNDFDTQAEQFVKTNYPSK